MAVQKASVVNLFNYTPYQGQSNFQSPGQNLSLVKDAYSGKYYGSQTYKEVMSSIGQATAYFTSIIKKAESGGIGMDTRELLQAPINMNGGSPTGALSPYEEAKQGLSSLQGFTLDASSYVQKPQMIESFNNDPDGWNKYFEGNYKNPRIAEENDMLAQRNAQGKTTGTNPLIANKLEIRKEVGTGIGKSSVGLNPFGQLDAGLNI